MIGLPVRKLLLTMLVALAAPAGARAAAPVAIFYYPWYGTPKVDGAYEHWEQNGAQAPLEIASEFYPARGPYSSSNPRVVRAQMRELARAGVGEVIVSWWGWGSPEDRRLPAVMREARAAGLAVAVHLEPYEGRTLESVRGDLAHLEELGIRDFYVYRATDFPAAGWAALRPTPPGVRLFAQTSLPGFAAAGRFDGLYTYDIVAYPGSSFGRICGGARMLHLLCEPSVGPGFDARRATGDPRVKPRCDGATYDSMWRAALAAGSDAVTITSYNEWHEGTQIEPAHREPARLGYSDYDGAYGRHGRAAERAYLDRTRYWSDVFAVAR
jgi:hypothetical protein